MDKRCVPNRLEFLFPKCFPCGGKQPTTGPFWEGLHYPKVSFIII
jgi:hypothetical protein